MEILKLLSELERKEAPATFDVADPMPKDTVIIGTVPEDLRMIACEAVRLNIMAKELNDAAIKETLGDMLSILNGQELSEATARRQATLRETDILNSLSEALGKIFWYELKMNLPKDVESGTIAISKNWEVYFQKNNDAIRCPVHGIIIPVM